MGRGMRGGGGGVRVARNLTKQQLGDSIVALENLMQRFIGAVSSDFEQLHTLIMAVLNELNLAEQWTCEKCEETIWKPNLKSIETSDICPSCGEDASASSEEE